MVYACFTTRTPLPPGPLSFGSQSRHTSLCMIQVAFDCSFFSHFPAMVCCFVVSVIFVTNTARGPKASLRSTFGYQACCLAVSIYYTVNNVMMHSLGQSAWFVTSVCSCFCGLPTCADNHRGGGPLNSLLATEAPETHTK
jgi:hypothetical protein